MTRTYEVKRVTIEGSVVTVAKNITKAEAEYLAKEFNGTVIEYRTNYTRQDLVNAMLNR